MKRIFIIAVLAMAMFSGCTKEENVQEPAQVIKETKNDILGRWTNDEGEIYNFGDAYVFDGTLIVNGTPKEVSGDFNLVTIDGSDTTLTINTPDIRVSYYMELSNNTITLSDTATKEVVKILQFEG